MYIPCKKVAPADALSKVNPQDKMQLKGLDFTIHELIPCITPTQMSMICAKQKKGATMQLMIHEFASRVAQVLQTVGPSLKGIGP